MKIIEKILDREFPFQWVRFDFYPYSDATRREIYLPDDSYAVGDLLFLFDDLFGKIADDIWVYNRYWDFCLDVDDSDINKYKNLTEIINSYQYLLKENYIESDYEGSCLCLRWDIFLPIVLECICNHITLYSPIFYHKAYQFFFYFHHTGSIGIYTHEENEIVKDIINAAIKNYQVIEYDSDGKRNIIS